MELVFSNGVMGLFIRENSRIIISTEEESISGQKAGNMLASGRVIKCMAKVYLCGRMAGDLKENT